MSNVYPFVNKYKMAALLGLSEYTLKVYRARFWQEGVHFVRINSRKVLYNQRLCLNWLATRHRPELHAQFVEEYLQFLEQS